MHWRFLSDSKWLFLPDPEWRFSPDANIPNSPVIADPSAFRYRMLPDQS